MVGLALVALVLLAAGPLLAMLEVLPPIAGFGLYALGGLLSLVAAIGGLVSLVRGRGARALVLAIVPAAVFVTSFVTGLGDPPINDIATDLADPPTFVNAQTIPANAGRDFRYPADFVEVVRTGYPDLKALRLAEAPAMTYARVLGKARAHEGWEITREDPESHTFEGVATSKVFRFRDDFVVRIRPDGDAAAAIDMRSKSRDGIGDRGVNAARIRAFFAELSG